MAIKPRLSRAQCRVTIEALIAYIPTLSSMGREIAEDALMVLQAELEQTEPLNHRQQPVRWAYDTPEYKADIDAERGNPVEHNEQG